MLGPTDGRVVRLHFGRVGRGLRHWGLVTWRLMRRPRLRLQGCRAQLGSRGRGLDLGRYGVGDFGRGLRRRRVPTRRPRLRLQG
ncbi:hypothetical protein, partial [Streptomyces neyagawaensis]|uniref:hypothetical protein n=1 Tax=Streptomyces neyagawaensis TaxID=42238 RepID=UPI00146FCDEB